MKIKYYGNSCFLLKTKKAKLVTNPKNAGAKINLKRVKPDIVLLTHGNKVSENNHYIINTPGEYEVKEILVYGYVSNNKGSQINADIYMIDVEGITLGFIDGEVASVKGNILDEMGIVNILFVSLADNLKMKLSKLTDLVNKIDPQIVIPMDYSKEVLTKFTNSLGVKGFDKESSLIVKSSDFEGEDIPINIVVIEK